MNAAAPKIIVAAGLCLLTARSAAFADCDLSRDLQRLGQAAEEAGRRDPARLAALDGEFQRLYLEMEAVPAGALPDARWLREVCRTVDGLLRQLDEDPAGETP